MCLEREEEINVVVKRSVRMVQGPLAITTLRPSKESCSSSFLLSSSCLKCTQCAATLGWPCGGQRTSVWWWWWGTSIVLDNIILSSFFSLHLKKAIHPGAGYEGISEYKSVVYYQVKQPCWYETVKVRMQLLSYIHNLTYFPSFYLQIVPTLS